jgi:hypothetical protein
MANKTASLVFKLLTLLLFGVVSLVTLLLAYGYQINVKERDVVKTSIIDVLAEIKSAEVRLDGVIHSTKLPYQVKNIIPGEYTLKVEKPGYLTWKRKVEVKEDIVSIVNDILLVPEKISDFNRQLLQVDKGLKTYFGKDMLILLKPGDKKIRLISLYDNGTFKDEDFEIYREGIVSMDILSANSILLYYPSNVYGLIDFPNRGFKFFSLPAGIDHIKISYDGQVIYYLKEGKLYRVPLYILGPEKVAIGKSFLVRDKIDQYTVGFSGQLFFLSGGGFYMANQEGQNEKLIDKTKNDYTNLAFKFGKDYGTLILRDKNDQRGLFLVDKWGNLPLVEKNLKGQPFFNDYDQLLYANQYGVVLYYDPNTLEKKLIKQIKGDFEILGWFSNEGHFIVLKDKNVYLNDVYDSNGSQLISDFQADQYFVLNKAFYYLTANRLNLLYWLDKK